MEYGMENIIRKIPLHPPLLKGEKLPLFGKEEEGEIL